MASEFVYFLNFKIPVFVVNRGYFVISPERGIDLFGIFKDAGQLPSGMYLAWSGLVYGGQVSPCESIRSP
jgi:hypothetical protein